MAYSPGAFVLIALICAIVKAASGNRYSTMTEEQFEAQAQRSPRLGRTIAEVQKILDPSHHVEYAQEQQER
jgi:hypothetical protein